MRGQIIEAEHLARYHWASSLARGRRVLDAGCGTAYGSALLANAGAREVVGVDLDAEVLQLARPDMPTGVVLEAGDLTTLPYEDGSFDLVVCFEVIEHVEHREAALNELRRVLAPAGILAISSPNRETYPPGNPHHVHEYTPGELEDALSSRFAAVRLDRQHTWVTSAILDDARFTLNGDSDLGDGLRVRKLSSDTPGDELYTLALASQAKLPEVEATFELASQVELRKWNDLWHEQDQTLSEQARVLTDQEKALEEHAAHRHELERHNVELERHNDDLECEIVRLREPREQAAEEMAELRNQLLTGEEQLARVPELEGRIDELVQLNDDLLELNRELTKGEEDLDELIAIADRYTVVVSSSSWRLTRPLRALFALGRRLRR
jgi:hypothetical protein